MITEQEWQSKALRVYWMIEHGNMKGAIEALKQPLQELEGVECLVVYFNTRKEKEEFAEALKKQMKSVRTEDY